MVQQHTRMKAYLVIILITLVTFQECRARVSIRVFLITYNNSGGKLANGIPCDSTPGYQGCDQMFNVCLDFLGGSSNIGQCGIGNYTIKDDKLNNMNYIDFSGIYGIANNPKDVSAADWPGSMLLKVEVYDDEDILNYDNKVDQLHTEVRMNASRSQIRSFKLVNRTELTVYIGVYCDNNWLGPRCDCQHSNDDDKGHYQCFDDGHKKCHIHWYGPNCNIYCKMEQGRFQHYNCSANGSKMCHDNWYGSGCEKYCKPQKDNKAGYSCSSDGEKHCHSGWTGENCARRCEDEPTGVNCKTTTTMTNKAPSTAAEDIRGGNSVTTMLKTTIKPSSNDDNQQAYIITASVLGTLLFLALLVIAIICRFNIITCVKKTSNAQDQGFHMGDVHVYDYIDPNFIPSTNCPDLSGGTENQVTIHDYKHPTEEPANDASDYLEPSTNCLDLSGGTENQVTIHGNKHQTQAAANDASDYLKPSVTFGSGANEDIADQKIDEPGHSTESEVYAVDKKLNKDDELHEQEKTDNDYVGLDKAAMEADNILRRSDEALYTLMDGKPSRHQAHIVAKTKPSSGQNGSDNESYENVERSDALEKRCEKKTQALAGDYETAEETYDDVAGILEGAVGGIPLESEMLDHTYIEVDGDDIARCDEPESSKHTYSEVSETMKTPIDEDSGPYSYACTGPRGMFSKRPNKFNKK